MAVEHSRPASILVLCTENAVRSPMLEALLKKALGPDVEILSAGVEGTALNPFAAAVMQERGLDIQGHESHAYNELPERPYDLIIALSQPAYDLAHKITQKYPAEVEYWDTPEPPAPGGNGNRDQIIDSYRRIRDDLILHIRNRFGKEV